MTHKRVAALRTADDFRAHYAALGVTLPCDATPLRFSQLSHNTVLRYIMWEFFVSSLVKVARALRIAPT